MNNSLTIAKIRGIKIRFHISWLFVFAILTYSLSSGFYPLRYEFDTLTNWLLGGFSALLLFLSVLLHELAHSIIAQKKGLQVRSITLFFFGGLANIETDPEKPLTEFKIAIGGPIASFIIGLFFYILYIGYPGIYLTPVFDYLSKINFMLAIFNMIPAFPLDGGRVFRSILWAYNNDIKKATKIASNSGKIFGSLLIALGIITIPAGFWFAFMGLFLIFLADNGYKQVIIKINLENVSIKELITKRPLINPEWKIDEFLNWCKEQQAFKGFIKNDDGIFYVDISNLQLPNDKNQDFPAIKSIMKKSETVNVNEKDAFDLFKDMQSKRIDVIPVIDDNSNYLGVISTDSFYRIIKLITIQEKLNISKTNN